MAETESEYPVLVFSHGFGDLPELNAIKAEELASQGYVVVGINHTYDSALNILEDGQIVPSLATSIETESESEIFELLNEAIDIRAQDAQFVLDELTAIDAGEDPTNLLSGKLDLEQTGIFGYSLGGATAAKVLAEDERFKAGINLDGGLFGDVANVNPTQPFMFQNNEAFGTGESADAGLNQLNQLQQVFVERLENDAYEITIAGTEHNNFNDIAFLSPFLVNSGIELGELADTFAPNGDGEIEPTNPLLANEIINSYSTAFFDRYLNGKDSPLLTEELSPYPEVTLQAYPADGNDTLTGSSENAIENSRTESLSISIGDADISVDITADKSIFEFVENLSFDDLEIVRGQGDNAGDLLINFDSETIVVLDDIIGTEISLEI